MDRERDELTKDVGDAETVARELRIAWSAGDVEAIKYNVEKLNHLTRRVEAMLGKDLYDSVYGRRLGPKEGVEGSDDYTLDVGELPHG